MESTLSLLRRRLGAIGQDVSFRRADALKQRPRVIDAAAASAALLRQYRAARVLGDTQGMDGLREQLHTRWLEACAAHRHGEARAWHMAYLRAAEDIR